MQTIKQKKMDSKKIKGFEKRGFKDNLNSIK